MIQYINIFYQSEWEIVMYRYINIFQAALLPLRIGREKEVTNGREVHRD